MFSRVQRRVVENCGLSGKKLDSPRLQLDGEFEILYLKAACPCSLSL